MTMMPDFGHDATDVFYSLFATPNSRETPQSISSGRCVTRRKKHGRRSIRENVLSAKRVESDHAHDYHNAHRQRLKRSNNHHSSQRTLDTLFPSDSRISMSIFTLLYGHPCKEAALQIQTRQVSRIRYETQCTPGFIYLTRSCTPLPISRIRSTYRSLYFLCP